MKRLCVRTSLLLALLAVFTYLSPVKANAEEAQLWHSGITSTNIAVGNTSYDGNTRCEYGNVSSQFLQNITLVGNIFGVTDNSMLVAGNTYTNQCLYSTSEGLFGTNNLWSPDGNPNTVMPIDNNSYSVRSLGRSGFIIREGSPSSGLSVSYTADPFKDTGFVSVKTYGSGISKRVERAWSIDTSKVAEFYTYSDRSMVRFHEFATSNNGEYAVGAIAGRGLVRIHLPSGNLTAISNSAFNNGVGLFLSISNDGRYVMSSKAGSGRLIVFDLLNCLQNYSSGQWSRYDAFSGAGCANKDLYPELRILYPSITNVSGLHFLDRTSELELFMHKPNDQGHSQSQLVRLAPAGYISQARGYLALGDSFASGEGDLEGGVWYESGTDEQGSVDTFAGRNLCHLSRRSYPYLMAIELGLLTTNVTMPLAHSDFHSVACSGAKMHNVYGILGEKHDDGDSSSFAITDNQYRFEGEYLLEPWQPGYTRQLNYLNKISIENYIKEKIEPEIITISIGGNDAGFGQKLLACLLPGTCEFATSEASRAQVAKELAGEKKNLVKTYNSIKQEAPYARVFVIGYPQFVQASPDRCASNVHLDSEEVTFVHNATGYFNEVIRAASLEAGVTYVDVSDILTNVNLCSGTSPEYMAVNGITAGNDRSLSIVDSGFFKHGLCVIRNCIGAESYHPNQKGHQRYKTAILTASNGLKTENPEPANQSVPLPSSYFGDEAQSFVDSLNGPVQSQIQYAKMSEMIIEATSYKNPSLRLYNLYPNSNVLFEVHSDPIVLGGATAGADGLVTFTAELPVDLPSGYHEIHAYGFDEFGNPIHLYEPILVGAVENDFDGDGITNEADSCPVVTNSGIDIDEDGIDDACDIEALQPIQDEPPIEENPTKEQAIEETPVEFVEDKGAPNPETVAGDEQIVEQGTVLGVSTNSVLGVATSLAITGVGVGLFSVVGFGIIFVTVFLRQQEKH